MSMNTDDQLIYKAASMYYLKNLSQAEISQQLGVSRPKVSRLLSKARKNGIVNIQINTPQMNTDELTAKIKTRFGIEHVLIVPSIHDDPPRNLEHVAQMAAPFFQSFIHNGDKIGVSWGYTLLKVAEHLPSSALNESVVLQISGNLDNADSSNFANEIIRHFSDKCDVREKYTLPCPVIVENPIIVDLLQHDSKLSNIISQINRIDVAFPNIGVLSEDNCLWRTSYISTEEINKLHTAGSVGCICSRFIDINGKIVDPALDERTISLSLETLNKARHSCVCITSEQKIMPLLGCLKAKLVNVLAMDSDTADLLLEYSEKVSY